MNNYNPYNNPANGYTWGYDPYGQQYGLNGINTWNTPTAPAIPANVEDHVPAVNGVEGAKAFPNKKPNSDYFYRDVNKKGIIYAVVTDASGLPTVEAYKLQGPVISDEEKAERDKWNEFDRRLGKLEKAVLRDDKS